MLDQNLIPASTNDNESADHNLNPFLPVFPCDLSMDTTRGGEGGCWIMGWKITPDKKFKKNE